MPKTAQLSDAKRSLLGKYRAGRVAVPKASAISRKCEGVLAPLSLAQEQLWRREQFVPGIPPLYNECIKVRMQGPLEKPYLERAFSEIVRRHEIWRTTFETKAGAPVQVVQQVSPASIPVTDLRGIPSVSREAEAIRLVSSETKRPFRLQHDPPLRPMLVRMTDTEIWLFLIAHLIVLDGPSAYQIFPFELSEFYKAFVSGKAPQLPDLSIQCSDFACWQRESLNPEMERQSAYWRKQLGTFVSDRLWPNNRPRSSSRGYRGVIRPFEFSRDTSQKIKDFSRRENSTVFSVLLAAFAALVHSYSKQENIFLGTLSPSGRKRSEVRQPAWLFFKPGYFEV